MRRVAILGAGSWGTALAQTLCHKGLEVRLWARTAERADEMSRSRRNLRYLPDLEIDPSIVITHDIARACRGGELVIVAVPSHGLSDIAGLAAPHLEPAAAVMSAAKGFDLDGLRTMSQVLLEVLGESWRPRLLAMSGPDIAVEVALGLPAATVVAGFDRTGPRPSGTPARGSQLRVYSSPDLLGVETVARSRTSSPSPPASATASASATTARRPSSPGASPRWRAWGWSRRQAADLRRPHRARRLHPDLHEPAFAQPPARRGGGPGRGLDEVIASTHMVAEGERHPGGGAVGGAVRGGHAHRPGDPRGALRGQAHRHRPVRPHGGAAPPTSCGAGPQRLIGRARRPRRRSRGTRVTDSMISEDDTLERPRGGPRSGWDLGDGGA